MAIVFIPSVMQQLTNRRESIEVPGSTVREIIKNLDTLYPGCKDWLVEDMELKPNISVAIDGMLDPMGLLAEVTEYSEVHFVAALAGGSIAI